MTTVYVGGADALRREQYEAVYKDGKLSHYTNENGHKVFFYLKRSSKDRSSWNIFRERHDGTRRNDELFSRGTWEPFNILYSYILDARVEEDVTIEEVIETAVEVDKAFAEYARQNNRETSKF